jgi:hypothetical protein
MQPLVNFKADGGMAALPYDRAPGRGRGAPLWSILYRHPKHPLSTRNEHGKAECQARQAPCAKAAVREIY